MSTKANEVNNQEEEFDIPLIADNSEFKKVYVDYLKYNLNIRVELKSGTFDTGEDGLSTEEYMRYVKMVFDTKEKFKNRFIDAFEEPVRTVLEYPETNIKPEVWKDETNFLQRLMDMYDDIVPYTYADAMKIDANKFPQHQARVFTAIDIPTMIKECKHEKLKVDGIQVKHKVFSDSGEFLGWNEHDLVYEMYAVDLSTLGGQNGEMGYCVKCWCTTTNKEHFIWVDEQYKDDPLAAIASCCRIHKNIADNFDKVVKEIKRQGDVFLFEYNEYIKPEGELVPLTKEQYFGKLTCQS